MIKLLGTAMIVLGSGSAGFGFARAVRAQLRQLNALLAALEAAQSFAVRSAERLWMSARSCAAFSVVATPGTR